LSIVETLREFHNTLLSYKISVHTDHKNLTEQMEETITEGDGCVFFLKAESMIWNNSQHEPLGIFISLPLSRHEPWRLRRTKPVVDMESALRELTPDDRKEIFCANFLAARGNWRPYQKAWCGSCYTSLERDRFPVRLPKDEEGNLMVSD
jgi:hypothetical protein